MAIPAEIWVVFLFALGASTGSFLNVVVHTLSQVNSRCIYVLWGGDAKRIMGGMLSSKNIILESSHPSPLSFYRGFRGCDHFAEINSILSEQGKPEIDWNIQIDYGSKIGLGNLNYELITIGKDG